MQSLQERIDATIKAGECVDRAIMPQVDEKDIPELLVHLASLGIHAYQRAVDPHTLKGYQRIVPAKVKGIARNNRVLLSKPILMSSDGIIIDGNHRAAAARVVGCHVEALILAAPFAEVFSHVCSFPKTYEYGNGNFHPITN